MAALELITAHVCRTGAGSRDDRRLQRQALLDTFAAIAAGRDTALVQRVRRMQELDGTGGLSAQALRLGSAAHALDFDDYEDVGSTHPSACLVSALLPLAARHSPTMAQFLDAYTAGYETILAFGAALGHAHYLAGWHATGTLGTLGAAVAAARLIGLDTDRTATALSISTSMAAGLKAQFGSDIKPLHCGFAARNGVQAALLAKAGATARRDVIERDHGLLALFGGAGAGQWPRITLPEFSDHPPFFKPWPSCAYSHRAIEAGESLHADLDLTSEQIAAVTLDIPAPYADVAGFRAPASDAEARFSVTYCLATALICGRVSTNSFDPSALNNPDVRALEARITLRPYALPAGAGDMSPLAPDTVTLLLTDGTENIKVVKDARGGPAKPMEMSETVEKFVHAGGDAAAAQRFLDTADNAPFHPPMDVLQ